MMEGQKLSPQTGTSRFKIFIFFENTCLNVQRDHFAIRICNLKWNFLESTQSALWTTLHARNTGHTLGYLGPMAFLAWKHRQTHVIWTQDVSSLITRGFPFKNSMQMRSQHCEIWDRKGCSRNRVTRFSWRCFGKKGQIYFHLWSIIK